MARYIDADKFMVVLNDAQIEFSDTYEGLGRAKFLLSLQPTADVAPKSEVERLQCQVNRLKKYDEERDIALHKRLIANAKSEVAMEIFEVIDDVMIDHARGDIDDHWLYVNVAELKKKYTEESNEVQHS